MIRSTASWWLASALFAAPGVVACAPTRDVAMQKDLDDLRQELAASRRTQDELRNRLDRLEARTQIIAASPSAPAPASADSLASLPVVKLTPPGSATNAPDIDTSVPLHEGTRGGVDRSAGDSEKPFDLNSLTDRQTLPSAHAQNPAPRRAQKLDEKADAEFQEAIASYNEGHFAEAAAGFKAFAAGHPAHEAASDALYLAGMSESSGGHCEDAQPLFERVVNQYAASEVTGRALLGLGECEAKSGHEEAARKYLNRVLAEYPRTAEASQAQAALTDLAARRSPLVDKSGSHAP